MSVSDSTLGMEYGTEDTELAATFDEAFESDTDDTHRADSWLCTLDCTYNCTDISFCVC